MEVPVEATVVKEVEVPVIVEVPVYMEPLQIKPAQIKVKQLTTERRVILPQMKRAEIPQIQTVVERVIEPAPPTPVIVKTIHDTTIVTEDPTDIHHVELRKEEVARAAPPVRSTVKPVEVEEEGWKCGWWCWLPLLCLLPLCCLPLLFCCKKKKEYAPGPIVKPQRAETVTQKNLITKDPVIKEKKRKKKEKFIEEVVMVPVQRSQIIEETIVVKKEVPIMEYEQQIVRKSMHEVKAERERERYAGGQAETRNARVVETSPMRNLGTTQRSIVRTSAVGAPAQRGTNYAQMSPSRGRGTAADLFGGAVR